MCACIQRVQQENGAAHTLFIDLCFKLVLTKIHTHTHTHVHTSLQTRGTSLSGQSLVGSTNLFFQTGKDMVARKGMGCMYYGVVPRLLQQVCLTLRVAVLCAGLFSSGFGGYCCILICVTTA